MIFVIDIDDTISCTDEYSELYIKNFFKKKKLPYKQINEVSRYSDKKFDWDDETAINWHKNHGDKMMLKFPCKEYAVETINKLHSLGHLIVIATARDTNWHKTPEKTTIKWLKRNKICYDKLYVGRVDKENICEMEKADYFIDDDVDIINNVSHADNLTGKCQAILVTSNYNKTLQTPNGAKRIDNFLQLEEMLGI